MWDTLDQPPPGTSAWRLSVEHETFYQYTTPVGMSHHMACLRPLSDDWQRLLRFELEVEPQPFERSVKLDAFGNCHECFSISEQHDTLKVVGRSEVMVRWQQGFLPLMQTLSVKRVQDALADPNSLFAHEQTPLIKASTYVPLVDELRDYARACLGPERPIGEAIVELMHMVHRDFSYVPMSTAISTPVTEVFRRRQGVCQDFAHVMLGCLRAHGLAARYVSGYLLTDPPAGQPRLLGVDASHAWVSVWCPGLGDGRSWLELDPTNDCVPGAAHVRVAYGRDYADVPPLQGVLYGGGDHSLSVRVTTQPVVP